MKFGTIALVAIAVFGLIVMLLWNALMPPLFGWHALGYLQAVGLLVLARLLFGRVGRPGSAAGPWGRHWMARWASMSPQEREHLLARMREGGGWGCRASDAPTPGATGDSPAVPDSGGGQDASTR